MSKIRYQLSESEAQERLDEMSSGDADLSADLGLARYLAECAASKSPHLATALLQTVARIANQHFERQTASGEMLHRSAVVDTAEEIVRIFCKHFRDLPEFNERIDAVAAEILSTVEGATNPKKLPSPN
jgi:hypothetical protein